MKSENDPSADRKEWYLADRNTLQALGPFSQNEIIQKIDRGQLRVDDYLWSPRLDSDRWARIFDVPLFDSHLMTYPKCQIPKRSQGLRGPVPDAAKIQYNKKGHFGIENLYRRFPRAPLASDVIIHDNKTWRKGTTVDISEKGVFISLPETDLFEKGQEVVVTLKDSNDLETFSATAVVMRTVSANGFHGYGVFFLRLNPRIRQKIAQWVLKVLSTGMVEHSIPSNEAA